MRRYLCTIEEVQENEQRTKRRRIDPGLNEVDIAGHEQQWVNQRQQAAAVEPRTIQNTRRGKNMRLDSSSARIAEYLEKQITKSKQILAEIEGDNDEQEEDYEENEDIGEDLGVSHFDIRDELEEYESEVICKKRHGLESKTSTLDECGKPNSEMLEIMARRQQKYAQKKGQNKNRLNQSKFDTPDASSLAASIIGTQLRENMGEPMEVDTITRGRNTRMAKMDADKLNGTKILSVTRMQTDEFEEQQTDNAAQRRGRNRREQLDASVSQDGGKLTPAMQEILARKQQAVSKLGHTKKLDQTVSSTTEFISSISTGNQPVERPMKLGRRSIRSNKNDASNDTTTVTGKYQQADVAVRKGRSKSFSLQPDTTVLATGSYLKTHNESVNKDKSVSEDVGKLTPAMQEILARKQQKIASKQGQTKKLEQTVTSTTETIIPIVKQEDLSPKLIQEFSKSVEVETKTVTYSKSVTENTGKPTSAMQEVLLQKQQQVASKPRKSRKLDQTVTSTVESSSTKVGTTQSHFEAETKTRRKSTRQPQPNISGARDSVYRKPQEENKDLQKEDKVDQLASVVSENTSKLTPAMKEILARKQQKEAASKQGYNKKLNQSVTSTTEPVSHAPADQASLQQNQPTRKPAVNETKAVGGRSTRKSRMDKSIVEVADSTLEKIQQPVDEPIKKGRGKKKEVPNVSSTAQIEEPSVAVETKAVSARGKRRTTAVLLKDSNESTEVSLDSASKVKDEHQTTKRGKKAASARSEDLNTTQKVENLTPAMQQLLAKKQQRALEKSAKKGKK